MEILQSNVYCVLCGGPFDLENDVYNLDPQSKAYQWLYDVRLLGPFSAFSNLRLTQADDPHTNISGTDEIFLSEGTRWVATDSDCFRLDNSYYQVLSDDEDGEVIVPLHWACIEIGLRVLELHPSKCIDLKNLPSIARLYWVLRLQFHFCKYFGGVLGNDLLDLGACYGTFGPRSVLAIDELGWWGDAHEKFLTDPIRVPSLTAFVTRTLQATPRRSDNQPSVAVAGPTRDPQSLEQLPNEVLDRISDYLPPMSVIDLHGVSRSLAMKVPLDDRFWKTRLRDGTLLPHLWDLDAEELEPFRPQSQHNMTKLGEAWNWKSLVQLLVKKEFPISGLDPRLDWIPPGFWNRCRIWQIIEEACVK